MVSEKRNSNLYSFCLPDDLLFMIFLCLPANVLYNVMRFVCRGWYNIIQSPVFISAHLQKQSITDALLVHHDKIIGFVIKPRSHSHGGGLEVENLNFEFVRKTGASCNGLLFVIGPIKSHSYVINPVTKQYLPLPLFPGPLVKGNCCFGYAAASRVYKVMQFTEEEKMLILSVGIDKAWREVDMSGLSPTHKKVLSRNASWFNCAGMMGSLLTLRGYVYWVDKTSPSMLSFDMETETFGEIPLFPVYSNNKVCCVNLMAMETCLCLCVQRGFKQDLLYEFWLLKNQEIGEWEKVLDVNVKGYQVFKGIRSLKPVGWLRSMELLVFKSVTQMMVYNVNTRQVHQTKEMNNIRTTFGHPFYVESLVPLNNLSFYKSGEEDYYNENMRAEFEECKEMLGPFGNRIS